MADLVKSPGFSALLYLKIKYKALISNKVLFSVIQGLILKDN